MSLKTRKRVIWAKLETSSYATDAVPAAADAVLCANVQHQPLVSSPVERAADRSTFGNKRQLHVDNHASLTFDIELVGSGTLGTAPAWGKLMQACGCAEVVVGADPGPLSVAYNPSTMPSASLTIVFNEDGVQQKLLGCRGSFQVTMNDLQVPVIRFTFMGLYAAPTAVSLPAATGEADYMFPKPVSSANTTVTLGGTEIALRSLTLDGGQQVTYFDDEGVVEITDRRSAGSISFLAQPVATKNWVDVIATDTPMALLVNHHQADAYRVIIGTPAGNTLQLISPQKQDDRGRVVFSASLSFEPTSAGDDEWQIRLAAT